VRGNILKSEVGCVENKFEPGPFDFSSLAPLIFWVNWLRQSHATPLTELKPSDWYILQNAPREIALLAVQQANIVGGIAAGDTVNPSGISGKGPNLQLGIGAMSLGMSCGCK